MKDQVSTIQGLGSGNQHTKFVLGEKQKIFRPYFESGEFLPNRLFLDIQCANIIVIDIYTQTFTLL